MKDHTIGTARLLLNPIREGDADALLGVFRDPAVRRYLLDDQVVSRAWMTAEIASSDASFAEQQAGLWGIRLLGESDIIGFVGFREFFDPPQRQLLYGLLPNAWQRGIATEAATAVCDYAFRWFDFKEIRAATDLPNHASVRVLDRLGMKRDRITQDGPWGTGFYSIDRKTWMSRVSGRSS